MREMTICLVSYGLKNFDKAKVLLIQKEVRFCASRNDVSAFCFLYRIVLSSVVALLFI